MGLPQARAGALNKLIDIEYLHWAKDSAGNKIIERDSMGQPIEIWRRLCRVWAAVESTDTSERFQAARNVGHKLRKFQIRFRKDVTFEHRILYQDEYYNIRSIKDLERRGRDCFLEILGEVIDGEVING